MDSNAVAIFYFYFLLPFLCLLWFLRRGYHEMSLGPFFRSATYRTIEREVSLSRRSELDHFCFAFRKWRLKTVIRLRKIIISVNRREIYVHCVFLIHDYSVRNIFPAIHFNIIASEGCRVGGICRSSRFWHSDISGKTCGIFCRSYRILRSRRPS